MPKLTQSQGDLSEHLQDHLRFLMSSCEAFDGGHNGEAKRLAVSLRVLLHDTAQSHSLLGQLGRLDGKFISTAIPHDPNNIASHGGLIMTAMSRGGSSYFAPLDDVLLTRWLSFSEWWNEIVFVDAQRATLSRRDLVLAVANQDGGAHVDPNLSETYARLSRHNSMGWIQVPGNIPIPNVERAAVRQIAHEAVKTLTPKYRKQPKVTAEIIVGGAMVHKGTAAPPMPHPEKLGRNELCPCGSGSKYKKCHGAI